MRRPAIPNVSPHCSYQETVTGTGSLLVCKIRYTIQLSARKGSFPRGIWEGGQDPQPKSSAVYGLSCTGAQGLTQRSRVQQQEDQPNSMPRARVWVGGASCSLRSPYCPRVIFHANGSLRRNLPLASRRAIHAPWRSARQLWTADGTAPQTLQVYVNQTAKAAKSSPPVRVCFR